MNKWFLTGTAVVAAALFGGGCSSLSLEDRKAEPVAHKSVPGERLTAAFVRNDEKAFLAELPAELQKEFPADKFHAAGNSLAKSLGKPVSFRYLTRIEHPLVNVEVWLIRFERTGEDGKLIHQEALFRVISGILDEKPGIISFNFL